MHRSPDQEAVFVLRYRRSKAHAFGAIMFGIGSMIAWVAWDALDPGRRSPSDDGAALQALPAFVRVRFFAAIGLIVLAPGATMLWASLANLPIVRIHGRCISDRTIFGRRRKLAWRSVGSVTRLRREYQIVVSPAGHGGLLEEIWDRKLVLLDVGMLDRSVDEVEAIVRRFRPDLSIDIRDGSR